MIIRFSPFPTMPARTFAFLAGSVGGKLPLPLKVRRDRRAIGNDGAGKRVRSNGNGADSGEEMPSIWQVSESIPF